MSLNINKWIHKLLGKNHHSKKTDFLVTMCNVLISFLVF